MKYLSSHIIFVSVLALLSWGCEGFFGKKTDTEFLDVPQYNDRTVAYVPIQPVLQGFGNPIDIIAGWDELMYVVDSASSEIISLDQAGRELARFKVPGLQAIAQDRSLDLLAAGTKDTTISGTKYSLPAIYRIDQNKSGVYGLKNAKIVRTSVHPFCFNPASTPTLSDQNVVFQSIAVLADNKYYVARHYKGSNTASGNQADAVVIFNTKDAFESPVFVNTSLGLLGDYFVAPKSIVSYCQPPQSPNVNTRGDFLFCSPADYVVKVQGISKKESDNGVSYEIAQFSGIDTSKADRFLYTPYRFSNPSDVTIAGDGTGYIFVTDASKDSVYQFNGKGYEGINPPPGSTSSKAVYASFGGTGEGLLQFRRPRAIAYANQILYVADAGNQRILRFKLTTDFN
ncbi:MAG: hypothetical protein ACKVTZ_22860 [Bacteroidia bacterium]